MKKLIIIQVLILLIVNIIQSQQSTYLSSRYLTDPDINIIILNEEAGKYFTPGEIGFVYPLQYPTLINNNTHLSWSYNEPFAIGRDIAVDHNGNLCFAGWFLNDMKFSLYNYFNNVPVWEYPSELHANYNYTSISQSGRVIAAGKYKSFLLFSPDSSLPFFTYEISNHYPDHRANLVNLSSGDDFLVAVAAPRDGLVDSAIVFGFSTGSNIPLWKRKIFNNVPSDYGVTGLKMSGNDSLFILSTVYKFFIIETYTGNIIFTGNIGPYPNSNTQENQGINRDGSVISTSSHDGYLSIYTRQGNNYNLKWRYKDNDTAVFNQWITVSDISDDGRYIACGTLDWYWSYYWIYNGQVKYFNINEGPVPKWSYKGMGDMVTSVSFSNSGRILSACSWGDNEDTLSDLVIFNTSVNSNIPIFSLKSPGSLFSCATSGNGSRVYAAGKNMHARQLGYGGNLYNISVDTNDTPIGIINLNNNLPLNYSLSQNFPNPFNPLTNIKFSIPKSSNIKLRVFDMLGNEVQVLVNGNLSPGNYETDWNASKFPSGVYFYRLETEYFTETKKMVLIK